MTRIIAGAARSLTIATPTGSATRPTSDRVREAVFGSLQARGVLDGAAVLDLYAGSGALGLEALSRGASSVELVESASQAARVAASNAAKVVEAVGAPSSATHVSRATVTAFLARTTSTFDVVFLDPPYPLTDAELASNLVALIPHLAPDALVVVERSSRGEPPRWPDGFEAEEPRRYGETSVYIAAWVRGVI